jgi:septal ring factor EnvC (AmiA/AmiB activator)
MIPFLGPIAAVVVVTAAGCSIIAYGYGVRNDKARSDLVISKLTSEAATKLADANQENRALSVKLQVAKDKAEQDLQAERESNDKKLATLATGYSRLRNDLAAFARGPGPDKDSLAACRSEAGTIGDVLARALQAHGVCSNNAEAEAGNARLLLGAWPRN